MRQILLTRGEADLYDLPIDEDTEHLAIDAAEATAVLIALCTDRRATQDQARDASDRGGWWGETYLEDRPFGSLLWTLKGRSRTAETLALAESFTRDALVRWTDAGYELSVTAAYEDPNSMRITASMQRPDGSTLVVAVPVIT